MAAVAKDDLDTLLKDLVRYVTESGTGGADELLPRLKQARIDIRPLKVVYVVTNTNTTEMIDNTDHSTEDHQHAALAVGQVYASLDLARQAIMKEVGEEWEEMEGPAPANLADRWTGDDTSWQIILPEIELIYRITIRNVHTSLSE